jgi:hypothetical protein
MGMNFEGCSDALEAFFAPAVAPSSILFTTN